jgi:hypothetical protein
MPANLAVVPEVRFSDGRAAQTATAPSAELVKECEAWLAGLSDDFLACYRNHNFPKLKAKNGKFPRGVSARPIPETRGHFQIWQRCRDCGIKRWYTCTARDVFDVDRRYEYEWPDGYNMPRGGASYITWGMILAERNRRFAEALIGLAA